LIHGTADDMVPIEQSRLLAERLARAGARVNFLSLSHAGHDFEERNDANARLAAAATMAFLDAHLKGTAAKR
jgi:dipeptidyl aminopeptidase/acylaminoacyl peptidase